MPKWKDIWKARMISGPETILQTLIYLDGFDSGAGRIDEISWCKYVDFILSKIDLKDTDTFFEVGCGSGAFLYPLYLRNHRVGGIDYSDELIANAKKYMSAMNFEVKEACDVDVSERYDYVISNGVFHYFKDTDYAEQVIRKMVQKAKKGIFILEVPNCALKALSEQIRGEMLPKKEYEKKYKGLEHLYYTKEWFIKIAEDNNLEIDIFDQKIENYGNSQFRFNVMMRKP